MRRSEKSWKFIKYQKHSSSLNRFANRNVIFCFQQEDWIFWWHPTKVAASFRPKESAHCLSWHNQVSCQCRILKLILLGIDGWYDKATTVANCFGILAVYSVIVSMIWWKVLLPTRHRSSLWSFDWWSPSQLHLFLESLIVRIVVIGTAIVTSHGGTGDPRRRQLCFASRGTHQHRFCVERRRSLSVSWAWLDYL